VFLLVLVDVGQLARVRLLADNRDAVGVLSADLSAMLQSHVCTQGVSEIKFYLPKLGCLSLYDSTINLIIKR
jgi:hypothetical protein